MDRVQINSLHNANVYVDGRNFLGRTKEFALPDISAKMAEHDTLGLIGTPEFATGLEKIDGKITFNSYYAEVMSLGVDPFTARQIQVRGSMAQQTQQGRGRELPVVVFLTATIKKQTMGTHKRGDALMPELEYSATYFRLEIDGRVIQEIDILNAVWKVNGVDLLADMRANLGL